MKCLNWGISLQHGKIDLTQQAMKEKVITLVLESSILMLSIEILISTFLNLLAFKPASLFLIWFANYKKQNKKEEKNARLMPSFNMEGYILNFCITTISQHLVKQFHPNNLLTSWAGAIILQISVNDALKSLNYKLSMG